MKTIHIDEICEGDNILIDLSPFCKKGNLVLTVNEIDFEENCVRCKDNYLDFYPDENGFFIQP